MHRVDVKRKPIDVNYAATTLLSILIIGSCNNQEDLGKNRYEIAFFEEQDVDYRIFINELIGFYDRQLKAVDTSNNYIDYAIPLVRGDNDSLTFAISYDAQVEFMGRFHDSTLSKIWFVDRIAIPSQKTRNFGLLFNPYGAFLAHFDKLQAIDFEVWSWAATISAMGNFDLNWHKPIAAFQYSDTSTIERKLYWVLAAITVNDQIHRARNDSSGPKIIEPVYQKTEDQEHSYIFEEEQEIDSSLEKSDPEPAPISGGVKQLPEEGFIHFDKKPDKR